MYAMQLYNNQGVQHLQCPYLNDVADQTKLKPYKNCSLQLNKRMMDNMAGCQKHLQ
jgi:hypothetical protein